MLEKDIGIECTSTIKLKFLVNNDLYNARELFIEQEGISMQNSA